MINKGPNISTFFSFFYYTVDFLESKEVIFIMNKKSTSYFKKGGRFIKNTN